MRPFSALRRAVLPTLACLASMVGSGLRGETPKPLQKNVPAAPALSLPLETFGYRPGASSIALRAGFTSATVWFIDADHLLLTFSARKLMPRSADQQEGDDDNTVRAQVIHLPDGHIVRETEWRMHDRAPYLWPLANGRFLVRERGDLYSLDPLGTYRPEHLGRRLVLHTDHEIRAVQLSPAHDLLLVQTTPRRQVGDDPDEKRELPVSVDFFRVVPDSDGVRLARRGHAIAHSPIALAFTSMGVLQTVKEDRMHWGLDFKTYAGKKLELAGFTSTCRPSSIFVSDAEFFAYGCRGGEDLRLMGGFNLLAEAKWVFTIDDPPLWLAVSSAPEAERFAIRGTLTTSAAQENDRLGKDDIRAQEVRVYSSREGTELLRATVSPAQRPAGNFSLSPNGLKLAVLHGSALEIYNLPPVSAEDRKLYERELKSLDPLKTSLDADVLGVLTHGLDKPEAPE